MSDERQMSNLAAIRQESREIWDTNAEAWDARMGDEGGGFQKTIIYASIERLLNLQPGESVLDMACGNGAFSRRLASLGARVTAFDFSSRMIERARQRSTALAGGIDYHVIDATDAGQLAALGERRYAAAVCSMALMDIPDIDPLLAATARLLKPEGCFIFSVMHPCFNGAEMALTAELSDRHGTLQTTHSIRVFTYLNATTIKGLAIAQQPIQQYYFHRPISALFDACFRAGLVLDGIEEPIEPPSDYSRSNPLAWGNFSEFPPVLTARLRVRG